MMIKRIVVLGGGSGTSMVLRGFRKYRVYLSAIVSMFDDGGSSGVLRRELNVLPPGDVRQCLLALAGSNSPWRKVFNYRFRRGSLIGHNLGNLILAALELMGGDFGSAVEEVSRMFKIQGEVIPVTFDTANIMALAGNKKIIGQRNIHAANLTGLKKFWLSPRPRLNLAAKKAILKADILIIGPGDIFSSILPVLIMPGIREAIQESRAKKVYVANLVTKPGHTDNFNTHDFRNLIERYVGSMDAVIYDSTDMPLEIFQKWARPGEKKVTHVKEKNCLCVSGKILDFNFKKPARGDLVKRNLIQHNPARLARLILKTFGYKKRV